MSTAPSLPPDITCTSISNSIAAVLANGRGCALRHPATNRSFQMCKLALTHHTGMLIGNDGGCATASPPPASLLSGTAMATSYYCYCCCFYSCLMNTLMGRIATASYCYRSCWHCESLRTMKHIITTLPVASFVSSTSLCNCYDCCILLLLIFI